VNYVVKHQVKDGLLHLQLEADATGWLGFGIADPNSGHMKGADLLTVSVTDGVVNVEDRYALFSASTYTEESGIGYEDLWAFEDVQQDWTVISGQETSGRTQVYVTRPLSTSDRQDREILAGESKILWSRSSQNSDKVGYHGSTRGVGMITFFDWSEGAQGQAAKFPDYDGVWEKRMANWTLPPHTTRYVCQSFEFDTSGGDKHIIAIRPVGVKKWHHHALLHICDNNWYWQEHVEPSVCSEGYTGIEMGLSPLGSFSSGCAGQVWIWGAGAGDFILPAEAGFRVGEGPNKISHVIFEIHYDNPTHAEGIVDDMGFQVFWTSTLRPHDAGQITLGDPTVTFGLIEELEPGHSSIHRQASCPQECTKDFEEPIHVFAQLLHMHHYGHKIYTERYDKDGNFIDVPNRIDFWDNAFQPVHSQNMFTLNPGDSLQTHCYYNTAGASNSVYFGLGTGQEMCMDFLFYYPAQYRGAKDGENLPFAFCAQRIERVGWAQQLTACGSLSQEGSWKLLGLVDLPNVVLYGGQKTFGDSHYEDPLHFGEPPTTTTTGTMTTGTMTSTMTSTNASQWEYAVGEASSSNSLGLETSSGANCMPALLLIFCLILQ